MGAPEAYILNRMSARWKGIFLLVILGPLLISVVARTLGWALLFGGATGVINKALLNLGVIASPIPFMFTETGVVGVVSLGVPGWLFRVSVIGPSAAVVCR